MHEAVRLRSLKVGATRHGRLDVVAERIQDPGSRKLLSVVTISIDKVIIRFKYD